MAQKFPPVRISPCVEVIKYLGSLPIIYFLDLKNRSQVRYQVDQVVKEASCACS